MKATKFLPKTVDYRNNGNAKLIIFSHGFGVRHDARGMFTEIADSLKGFDFLFFDYGNSDASGNTYVGSLEDQKKAFLKAYAEIKKDQYKEVNIISHSFGIVVSSLLAPSGVDKFIALAPPPHVSREKQLEMLMAKPGGKIDLSGWSERPRSDGTITYIHHGFYDSLEGLDIPAAFSNYAVEQKFVIAADQDEIVDHDYSRFEQNPGISVMHINGNHNFEGEDRKGLVDTIRKLL